METPLPPCLITVMADDGPVSNVKFIREAFVDRD